MTLKLYQLEKDMEIRLSIGRRVKEREIERGIGRGIRALLVENQENIYTMTTYFEEYK